MKVYSKRGSESASKTLNGYFNIERRNKGEGANLVSRIRLVNHAVVVGTVVRLRGRGCSRDAR